VSEAIVRFTLRTGEDVVLANASEAGPFTSDPYVATRGSRSILCTAVRHQDRIAGVLFLENELSPGTFTAARLAVLRLLVSQAAIAFENSLLFEKVKGEVTERTRAEATVRFLANAGAELAASLDEDTVYQRVARLVVPALADWSVVDIVEEDGRIVRVAGVHANPAKRDLMLSLAERSKSRPPAPATLGVIRSREAMLLEEVTEEHVRMYVPDPETYRIVQLLGARSAIVVPMIAHGRAMATISCVFATDDRRYGPGERAILLELAHRAALAIDNARLYRKANEAIRLREEFLAVASHELRTPLTSLLLTVQSQGRLLGPSAPAATRDAFGIIDRQSHRLAKLVEGLLNVSEIASGGLTIDREPMDLSGLSREVAARFADEAARAGCTLRVHADEAVIGIWDRSRLDQVISNLLSNAIKFGASKPVDLTVSADRDRALLVVEDGGIGIPPERLPSIFDRFERGVSAHQYGGLGLGLYIARTIVDKLGGGIRCESASGAGARFMVSLPRQPQENLADPPNGTRGHGRTPGDGGEPP
jgi:signal transduction histidine kinase